MNYNWYSKNIKRLTQWALLPLGMTIFLRNDNKSYPNQEVLNKWSLLPYGINPPSIKKTGLTWCDIA